MGLKAAFCSSGSAAFLDGTSERTADCLRSVGSLLSIVLLIDLFEYYISALSILDLFASHLQAWNEFVTISFPDEQFTKTWKKTLLADLERRIQEVRRNAPQDSLRAGFRGQSRETVFCCA